MESERSTKARIRELATRLPWVGNVIETELLKRAIASGALPNLVPVEQLRSIYTRAAEEQGARVDGLLTYFEAGVFAGQSTAVWHGVTADLTIATRMFGADSFEGLPASVVDDEGGWLSGSFACPRSVTEWNLRRLGVPTADVELIEGWFDQSLTPELADQVGTVHETGSYDLVSDGVARKAGQVMRLERRP